MSLKRSLVLGLALLFGAALVPADAAAQTGTIRLTNYGNSGTINTTEYGTVLASPYQGYFAGDPTNPLIDFFCIDFEHYAPPLNHNYNVRLTNLGSGNVGLTRHGAETGALTRYRQIAWLVAQRHTVDATQWKAIQLAVWQTFSGSCANTSRPAYACARYGDVGLNALASGWRQNAIAGAAAMNAADFGHFRIATGYGVDGARQEFMYVTPEPETYALMGMGLITLFFAWRRRRKRDADEPAFASGLAGF